MAIPKNTFLTKKRLDDATESMELEAKRESGKGNLTNKINREIRSNLPERGIRPAISGRDSYYGISGDLPEPKDEALTRAKAESNLQRYGFDKDDPTAKGAQKAVQNLRDAKENQKLYGMKKGGKVKKYADGGMTQQPTYPFYGNQPQAGGQNGGTNQTFNMQPQANAAPNPQQPQPMQTFKKGGKVSSASSRADGCAIRGKTRA